jgi:hypothetical protein
VTPPAAKGKQGRARIEEPFMLTAMASLLGGTLWMWVRYQQFLEYFYSPEFLALAHVITLGFVTSLMMGVLLRLAPMSLRVNPRSGRLARVQFVLFFVGASGMIFHFWIAGWNGMAWATLLVLAAALVQLVNFSAIWRCALDGNWIARYVATAMVYLVLAASLGALLGFNKAFASETSLLPGRFTSNLFAHIHLAGVGWVTTMIFGFQLTLVPTTRGRESLIPIRFWLLQVGTLGLTATLLADVSWQAPFAAVLLAAIVWQTWGPARAFVTGRAREWEVVPLVILVGTAVAGMLLASGIPSLENPLRMRVQFAYGYAGFLGWIVLTIATVAFKLFPIWVWQERFQRDFGKAPVPGSLRGEILVVSLGLVFGGVVCFAINFFLMARWALLDLEYRPG